jgi:hypothetical protein
MPHDPELLEFEAYTPALAGFLAVLAWMDQQ